MKAEEQTKTVPQNKLQSRKIPQTLIQSYDFIMLKDEKKRRWKKQHQNQKYEEIFQKLKPLGLIKGHCSFQYKNSDRIAYEEYQLFGDTMTIEKVTAIHLKSVNKIKLIGKHGQQQNRKIKLNFQEDKVAFIFVENSEELFFLFSGIIVRKLILDDFLINDYSEGVQKSFDLAPKVYEGQIFKNQGYMGYKSGWEKRKVVIDQFLKSYKDDKCTFTLKAASEMWTRFDMYKGFFVIKLHQGLEKIQLGIPLVDFTNISSPKNWLLPLSRLVET